MYYKIGIPTVYKWYANCGSSFFLNRVSIMAEVVRRRKPFSRRFSETARRAVRHENIVLVGILAVITAVLAAITKGGTVTPDNIDNIVLFSAPRGLAAIGQFFVILTAGIDLSVGGVSLMCVLFGARLMTLEPMKQIFVGRPFPMIEAIPLMLLLGLGVGAFNGFLVSRVRVPPLIVTLGMWIMAKGAGLLITQGAIYFLPEKLAFIGQGQVAGIPVPTIILIAVAIVAYFILNYTVFGKSVYSVGGNPVCTHLSGIKVPNIQLPVYMISGLMASLAGLVVLSRVLLANNYMMAGFELDSIAACVLGGVSLLGGRGNLVGVIIGVIIIGVINNGMIVMALDPVLQDLVRGAVIFAAVAIDSWRRR